MPWQTFSVEHARSGRAGCKGCNVEAQSENAYSMVKWFHVDCFANHIRKGPPTPSHITGLNDLGSHDRSKVLQKVLPNYAPSNNNNNSNDSDI